MNIRIIKRSDMPKRQETKTYRSGIDGYEIISKCFDEFIKIIRSSCIVV